MAKGNSVPTGVKVISVLYYIGAVVSLLLGLAAIFAAGYIGQILSSVPGAAALGAGAAIVTGIVLIALAVLGYFVGRGLWKAQSWARIVAIILAILGILSALLSIIAGGWGSIVSLVIHAIIGGYLWFNKGVKAAFA